MAAIDLRRLDLNLVVALNALLQERSVSTAAQRLGVTQSAASQALGRLRRLFDDELLVRREGRYELSPLASSLLPQVGEAIQSLSQVFAMPEEFDPASSHREFVLCVSDYVTTLLGPQLARTLHERAPGCSLRLRPLPDSGGEAALEAAVRHVDALVVPRRMKPPGETLELFTDTWCCVVDQARAAEVATWSTEQFAAASWVAAEVNGIVPAVQWLREAGFEADVAYTTTHFSAVPFVVAGTPLLGVVHRRLAELLTPSSGTAVVRIPGPTLTVQMVAFTDNLRAQHPATQWLLDVLAETARQLPPAVE